jgi:hypothetical protein
MIDILLNYFKTINVGLILLYLIRFLQDFLCTKYKLIKECLLNNGGVSLIFKEFVASFLNFSSFNQTVDEQHTHHH